MKERNYRKVHVRDRSLGMHLGVTVARYPWEVHVERKEDSHMWYLFQCSVVRFFQWQFEFDADLMMCELLKIRK